MFFFVIVVYFFWSDRYPHVTDCKIIMY